MIYINNSNGVVRKIDELGRIVIPKEYRKMLKIRDGENIIMIIDNNQVVIKKYSLFKDYLVVLESLVKSINMNLNKKILITDRDEYILVCGESKKEFLNTPISDELDEIIKNKKNIYNDELKQIALTKEKYILSQYIIKPIMNYGEVMGLIILLDDNLKLVDEMILNIITDFLNKYIEK